MSALRSLFRYPAYVVTAVVTVGLAVGANLVVFTIIDALWLRPSPVRNPDRVLVVGRRFTSPDGSRYSELGLQGLREVQSFEAVAGQTVTTGAFEGLRPRVQIAGVDRPLEATGITSQYFEVFGIRVSGREFDPNDGEAVGPVPVVISDRLWHAAWNGRAVLGEVIGAVPTDLRVVGIAQPGFQGARTGEHIDLWLPHRYLIRASGQDQGSSAIAPLVTFARLRSGGSVVDARKELAQRPYPVPDLVPLRNVFGSADRSMVLISGGDVIAMAALTACFVLLGGCAALMALAMVHYEQRRREFAVKVALGASRGRVAMALVRELGTLAFLGGVAALLVAYWSVKLLPQFSLPGGVDLRRLDLTVDWRVGLVGIACAILALTLGGVLPMVRLTRPGLALSLTSASASAPRSSLRLRRLILAVHIAATTVVLCAAAMSVRGVTRALAVGPGFDYEKILFARVVTRYIAVRNAAMDSRNAGVALDVVDRIRSMPGIEAVAAGASPLGLPEEGGVVRGIEVDGTKYPDLAMGWLPVDTGYLEALGVPLVAGRSGMAREAVITPSLATMLWGDDWPIGKQVSVSFGLATSVAGVADLAVGSMRLGRPPAVLWFGRSVSNMIETSGVLDLAIRARDPDAASGPVDRLLRASFPDAPEVAVQTAGDQVAVDLSRERMVAWMFSAFGLAALILAIVSTFGLTAHLVASRRKEFGLRIALGAPRADVFARAVWSSFAPAIVGSATGLLAALPIAHLIQATLFGPRADDALAYPIVCGLMVGFAAAGGTVAAMRVRHISPMRSLSTE